MKSSPAGTKNSSDGSFWVALSEITYGATHPLFLNSFTTGERRCQWWIRPANVKIVLPSRGIMPPLCIYTSLCRRHTPRDWGQVCIPLRISLFHESGLLQNAYQLYARHSVSFCSLSTVPILTPLNSQTSRKSLSGCANFHLT